MSNIQYFLLQSSWLCPDCSSVGNCANQCHACANRLGLLNLSTVLNPEAFNLSAEVAMVIGIMKEVGSEVFA